MSRFGRSFPIKAHINKRPTIVGTLYFANFTDTVTTSDSILKLTIKAFSDTVTTSETYSSIRQRFSSFSDSLTLAEDFFVRILKELTGWTPISKTKTLWTIPSKVTTKWSQITKNVTNWLDRR